MYRDEAGWPRLRVRLVSARGVVKAASASRFMKDPLADNLRQIDQTSQVLMQEFLDHLQAAKAQHPDATDASIYEAWSIQKIAGLQHSVMHLADHLRQLQDRVNKL